MVVTPPFHGGGHRFESGPPTMSSTFDPLSDALAAGDWVRSLGLALDAWRAHRVPELADVVDAIGARCDGPVPPAAPQLHAWWMERAFTPDPVEVGALLATLHVRADHNDVSWEAMRSRWILRRGNPVMGGIVDVPHGIYRNRNLYDRIAAVVEWPDDPRVARALTGCLVGPIDSVAGHGMVLYRAIARRIASLGDLRAVEALTTCRGEPRGHTEQARALQVELAAELLAGLAAPHPDPELEQRIAVCAAYVAPARPREPVIDVDALWREVAANPDDVGTRAILGDALVQAGDLRGDVIVLQCNARKLGRPLRGAIRDRYDGRVKTLVRREWTRWLGELALVLVRRGSEFHCGMLEVARIGLASTPPWAWAKARGHRELCAVHTVQPGTVSPATFAQFVDTLPRDPRRLVLDSPMMLDELATRRTELATTSLGLQMVTWQPGGRPLVATCAIAARLFPHLTEIGFDTPPGAAVAELLDQLVPELPRMFPALQRIRLTGVPLGRRRLEDLGPLVDLVQ